MSDGPGGLAVRLTRELVLDELKEVSGVIGAHPLADRFGERLGRKVSTNSVYRILGDLEASERVVRVVSSRGWAFVEEGATTPALLLVCSGCPRIMRLAAPEIAGRLAHLARRAAYRPRRLVLEVVGTCATCTAAA